MPTLLLKQPGSISDYLSQIEPVGEEIERIKFDYLFFDRFYNCCQFNGPAMISAGEKYPPLVQGPNLSWLGERERLIIRKPGYDCELAEFVRDIVGHVETKYSDDCFVHPNQKLAFETKNLVLTTEFLSVIPSPTEEFSLVDVEQFKEQRQPELRAFWSYVFELANSVNGNQIGNPDAALLQRLNAALDDLSAASAERWTEKVGRRIKLQFSVEKSTSFNIAAGSAAISAGVDPLLGAAMVLPGFLKLSLNLGPSSQPRSQSAVAMSYVSEIERSL